MSDLPADDARLEAMVDAWLAARAQGATPELSALCGDRLDLLPQLRALVALAEDLPGSERAEAHDPLLGRRLAGRYRLTGRVGAGGMGLVYGAHDEQLGRDVAVKVLDDLFAGDPARVERFRREARGLAALDDPHIVAVHDFDLTARPPFLVMDRIVGFDLAALVRALRETSADRLPTPDEAKAAAARLLGAPAPGLDELLGKPWPQVVALLGVQMGNALAAAHGVGVVHRDVKPSNFMLDGQGRVRLLDFGLARREADASLTRSDTRLGTPLYMAPEQVRGEEATVASDVYSLGATLFELLCLQPPFVGRGGELESQILYDDPPPPQRLRPRLPRDLGAVCSKALHKVPARRYASAGEVVADLERFLRFEPVAARVVFLPSPLRAAVGVYRRYRLALAAAVGLAVLAGALALGAGHFLGGERERERRAATQRLHAPLSPYLGFAGSRDDRLRDPQRSKQLALLDGLIDLDPGDTVARFLRLWVRAEEDPPPASVEVDRQALTAQLSPARFDRLYARVAVPLQQRNRADRAAARAVLETALRELEADPQPLDALARRLRALILLQQLEFDAGRLHEHADELQTLVAAEEQAHVRTAFTCFARAVTALVNDDVRSARELYLECNRLCPDQPNTLINLARVFRRLGQPEQARPFSEAALAAVAAPHASFLETHGAVMIALGDVAATEALLARFADDPDSSVKRALLLWRLRTRQALFADDAGARRLYLDDALASLRDVEALGQQGHVLPREASEAHKRAAMIADLLQDAPASRATVFFSLLREDPLNVELLVGLEAASRGDGNTLLADFLAPLVRALQRAQQDGAHLR